MEFRVLRYFLAVAHEENISRAAEKLNISQPALSRQLMDLEDELGVKLLTRAKRSTTLTEAGYLLKKRAEEMAALEEKTRDELRREGENISGSIRIGCGETVGMRVIAEAVRKVCAAHPKVRCHLYSTDGGDVKERLAKGTLDFGVLVQPDPPKEFDCIKLPNLDIWGVIMKKDSPLVKLKEIHAADLYERPLIVSRQSFANRELRHWFGRNESEMNIVATYTLMYNASHLVEAGLGYLVGLDRLLGLTSASSLTFRPLAPVCTCKNFFVWKRDQVFSRAALLLKEAVYSATELS